MSQNLKYVVLKLVTFGNPKVKIDAFSIEAFHSNQDYTAIVLKSGTSFGVLETVEQITEKLKKSVEVGYSEPDPYSEY